MFLIVTNTLSSYCSLSYYRLILVLCIIAFFSLSSLCLFSILSPSQTICSLLEESKVFVFIRIRAKSFVFSNDPFPPPLVLARLNCAAVFDWKNFEWETQMRTTSVLEHQPSEMVIVSGRTVSS